MVLKWLGANGGGIPNYLFTYAYLPLVIAKIYIVVRFFQKNLILKNFLFFLIPRVLFNFLAIINS